MSYPDNHSIWLWANEGVQSGFAAAYAAFRQDLLNAMPDPQALAELSSVHAAYLEELQRSVQSNAPSQRSEELGAAYSSAVQKIFCDVSAQSRVSAAFDSYIRSLKNAWTDVDPAAVQPADLGVIAQSIAWIASVSAELRQFANPNPGG